MSDKDQEEPMRRDKDAVQSTHVELTPDASRDSSSGALPESSSDSLPNVEPNVTPDLASPESASLDPSVASEHVTQISTDTEPSALNSADSSDANPIPVAEAIETQLPGAVLAKRRKEFRLSVEDVSSRLKISQRQIIALESNDFGQLASIATVRGFIRSYAKLLELDPAPLIEMLSGEPNPGFEHMVVRRPLPAPGLRGRQTPPPRRRKSNRPWTMLVLLAGVFVAVIFFGYRDAWFSLPSVDVDKVIDALPPLTGGREPSSSEAEADRPGSLASSGVSTSSASALEIKAREDSWVEVTTVDSDRRIISRLMKAGTTELVEVNEPVVLVVGNAVGVDASLRGQALNLRAVARDNVAKLSLK